MYLINRKAMSCFYSTYANVLRKGKWDLFSAVCLERKPVISREMNEIEVKFSKMLARIEFENSYKSDHEMRKEEDHLRAELLKHNSEEIDIDQAMVQTAQDFEDASTEEFKRFTFAPRRTEADKNNNVNSIERMLDRHLLLIIQQNIHDQKVWAMPQGVRLEGETMLQAAERVLKDTCGSDLKVNFLGNAPCGVYKCKYPKKFADMGKDFRVGAKVFFFKAQHVAGNIDSEKVNPNAFKWLGRQELEKTLPSEYYSNISQFLIDED